MGQKAYSRVIINPISPQVDNGRFAAKRYVHEAVTFHMTLLVDGHDLPKGNILIRHESERGYQCVPLVFLCNDEWQTQFTPTQLGLYFFKVEAAIDRFASWKVDLFKRLEAGQNVTVDLLIGQNILQSWMPSLKSAHAKVLEQVLVELNHFKTGTEPLILRERLMELFSHAEFLEVANNVMDKQSHVETEEYPLRVEPELARFSAWYEFFPRSTVKGFTEEQGTLAEAVQRLDYIQNLGFNIVYLPPISPIGNAFRKGKNNSLHSSKDDPGSPWAIGNKEGGHKALHPSLGKWEDFEHFVKSVKARKMELALDIAFQCSPDHPYVKEHPQWFKSRPDGTIQYAENPPKKYQDIYPFDFECEDWRALWRELLSVFLFWIEKGVLVFRVDNPHTKPFHFWEWLIAEVKSRHPEVIFLSEAFSRPKIMQYLAKVGFTQSYTYFTWRNSKWELTEYMKELTSPPVSDYFVPNFWPNTPDILPFSLQKESAPIYKQRLLLAATLSSNYGIYGPAYELMEHQAFKAGREEYLNSEKYEIKRWDLDQEKSLAPFIKKINSIRNSHVALQQNGGFRLHPVSNETLLAFSKSKAAEKILVIVNLDPENNQAGMVELPLYDWGLKESDVFQVQDLLTGHVYHWSGWRNYVELRPSCPAHIFNVLLSQGESR